MRPLSKLFTAFETAFQCGVPVMRISRVIHMFSLIREDKKFYYLQEFI